VVLGAAHRRDGKPSPALIRRARYGARLFAEAAAPRLILTGGPAGAPDEMGESEATAMARIAAAAGVPEDCLILEPRARSTLENARRTAEVMHRHGWRRALLVTDAFHMPRARRVFRAHGVDVDEAAVPGTAGSPLTWAREAAALMWYALRHGLLRRERGPSR
jgi:uncharacterized SAM-binding protein YcdF (DUF218 family)